MEKGGRHYWCVYHAARGCDYFIRRIKKMNDPFSDVYQFCGGPVDGLIVKSNPTDSPILEFSQCINFKQYLCHIYIFVEVADEYHYDRYYITYQPIGVPVTMFDDGPLGASGFWREPPAA